MHQGQLDENRRAPSRAPLPEPTTLSSNLLPLAFTGYLLVDGGNGSAPGERGIGGRRDFVVLYVVGYPDFGNLMMRFALTGFQLFSPPACRIRISAS